MAISSNHGQIMVALRELVLSLQPEEVTSAEVEVRGGWLYNGEPMRGITIHELGETYHEGTNGTQDIGYICGIVFAQKDDLDAQLTDDSLLAWRELIRHRLTDQRLNVTLTNNTPSEHVVIVNRSGENLTNPKKFPNWAISRIVATVWLRETN